ncbi:MAG: hypothetical protein ABI868_15100 [Acidobacteriota bacterium]
MATVSSGLAAVWRTVRAARIAATLWVVAAIVVWNATFDRVIVTAGRRYVRAAALAAAAGGPYLRIDDWMRPAVTAGLWFASAAAGATLILGWIAWRRSAVRSGPRP